MMENEKVVNKKSFSRFFATQILFSYLFSKDENRNIADLTSFLEEYYISEEFSDTDAEEYKKNINVTFLNELLIGTLEHIDEIDALLNEHLTGKYTFNVVDDLIKIILRLAMYEFLYTDIERKIVINEYVDIAGEYFDEKAISFVNATLDNLSKIEKTTQQTMTKNYNTFEFSKYTYNEDSGLLELFYRIDELEFVEEINFNPNNIKLRKLNDIEKKALEASFIYLHLVAGISYYKLFLPENIKINTIKLDSDQKDFFDRLYFNGLGEFSFRNNIDLRNKINFPHSKNLKNRAVDIELNNDYIVPIGGGKDSLVTLEMLKNIKNQKLYTFSVNNAKPIKESCELSGCENILVTRKIAPLLLEINADLKKYNAYNGHIPITSIIAFISVCTGILYNCNTTVISNESSANVGNILYNGTLVNHQWSKSFEAEVMMHDFIQKYIVPNFNYFSLLRPIYEIHIAKLFSKIKKYDKVFSSCNKNFKIVKNEEPKRWCCDCDKCRFVFLILAPFIEKDKLIEIFGENLLDDEKQYIGYEELTGFSGHKPFECVGEINESITAFNLLKNTDFKNDVIVKKINKKIESQYTEERLKELNEKYFGFDFENSLLNNNFKDLFNKIVNSKS